MKFIQRHTRLVVEAAQVQPDGTCDIYLPQWRIEKVDPFEKLADQPAGSVAIMWSPMNHGTILFPGDWLVKTPEIMLISRYEPRLFVSTFDPWSETHWTAARIVPSEHGHYLLCTVDFATHKGFVTREAEFNGRWLIPVDRWPVCWSPIPEPDPVFLQEMLRHPEELRDPWTTN